MEYNKKNKQRIMISITEEDIKLIDQIAKMFKQTRSKMIEIAIEELANKIDNEY